MRRLFLLLICFLFLNICAVSGWCEEKADDWGSGVRAIQELHAQADLLWPEHFQQGEEQRRGNEFDPSEYFRVLTHMVPPQGFVLEYIYCHGMDGRPVFYWKDRSSSLLESCEQYSTVVGEDGRLDKIAERIELDGTLESFYELFVFKALAGQYYLSWHANYNDTQIVISQEDVEGILAGMRGSDFGYPLTEQQQNAARALKVEPSVQFLDEGAAQVSVVTFSKWGGFKRITQKISRAFPHVVLQESIDTLVEYNCGVMF